MNWNDSQHDALDDLLRKAQWPDAQPEHVQRLESQWQRVVRRRKIRSAAWLAICTLVPVTLVAVSLAIWRVRTAIEAPAVSSIAIAESGKGENHSPPNPSPSERENSAQPLAVEDPSLQLVRDPNAFEQALALMQSEPRSPRKITTSITNHSGAQPAEVDTLFAALSNSRVSVRWTAARSLGGLNDPAVSDRLARMALSNVNRREALIALLSSSDPVAQQFLAYAEQNLALAPSLKAIALRMSGSSITN